MKTIKYIGKKHEHWNFNDGGRAEAGYRGSTRDCGVRALAICLQKPYKEVYDKFNLTSEKIVMLVQKMLK